MRLNPRKRATASREDELLALTASVAGGAPVTLDTVLRLREQVPDEVYTELDGFFKS